MAENIADGTGNAYLAKVGSDNRLWVHSDAGASSSGSEAFNYIKSGTGWVEEPYTRSVAISGAINVSTGSVVYQGSSPWVISGPVSVDKVPGYISSGNSTSGLLLANGSFIGEWENVKDYSIIYSSIRTDQDSKDSGDYGLNFEFSQDATDVDICEEYFISSGAGKIFSTQPSAQYFRIVYINGDTDQTLFRLQTLYRPNYGKPSSHRIDEAINDQNDAELTKSVITGKNPQGIYVNYRSTTAGNFKQSLEEYEPEFFNGSPLPVLTGNPSYGYNPGIELVYITSGTATGVTGSEIGFVVKHTDTGSIVQELTYSNNNLINVGSWV